MTRTCSKAIARQAILARRSHVDVNGARLWVEEEGEGPAVVFVHGGLGDSRLWEPQAHARASRFRTIATTSASGVAPNPGMEFSPIDHLVDVTGVEKTALAGLSLGVGLALDDTLRELWHVTPDARSMPHGSKKGPYRRWSSCPHTIRPNSAKSVRTLRAASTARNLSRSIQITT
jgi:hypothetical protein